MNRPLFFLLALTSFAIALPASPTPTPRPQHTSHKSEKKGEEPKSVSGDLAQSANGWTYVNGEWVHPDGYKYVNGRILRTTAQRGKAIPQPPGKLALQNAQKLTPTTAPAPNSKTAAEKAAEIRRKNLQARPAPQTGTNL